MKKIPWWWNEIPTESIILSQNALENNSLTSGVYTKQLEEIISETFGSYCAVLNSGTSSILAALLECDIGPGDEVIIPALTWIATSHAVLMTGATPVLVDVSSHNLLIDLSQIRQRISANTKAIVIVNFNGNQLLDTDCEDLIEFCAKKKIHIIEDSCKAMGTAYLTKQRTFSRTQCFSMGMISYLSVGYGGFALSKGKQVVERIKLIRDHGVVRGTSEIYPLRGANLKLSDVLSSIAIPQVPLLSQRIQESLKNYELYSMLIQNKSIAMMPRNENCVPTYMQVICKLPLKTDFVVKELNEHNIGTQRYHQALSRVEYLRKIPQNKGRKFVTAEHFVDQLLTIPSGSILENSTIRFVSEKINEIEEIRD